MHDARYPEVPPDFGNWLAGFIDGEGSFLISRQQGRRPHPRFALNLRADDRAILDEIVEVTRIGAVYTGRRVEQSGNQPTMRWCVNRKSDQAALVRLLDRHPLRAKKARDYAIWREAIQLCSKNANCKDHPDRDGAALDALAKRLREVRHYENDGAAPAPVAPSTGALELPV